MILVFGNGSCGTTILADAIGAHPEINCSQEFFEKSHPRGLEADIQRWRDAEASDGRILLVKAPLEETVVRKERWDEAGLVALVDDMPVIANVRSLAGYRDSWNRRQTPRLSSREARRWWLRSWAIIGKMVMRRPERVFVNSYEGLLADPESRMRAIYGFLGLEYSGAWQDAGVRGSGAVQSRREALHFGQ